MIIAGPAKSKVGAGKLDAKTWEKLRYLWEHDERPGWAWLRKESGVSVTNDAIRQYAASHDWKKADSDAKKDATSRSDSCEEDSFAKEAEENDVKTSKNSPSLATLDADGELTQKEKLFVSEYLKDFSPKAASERLGLPFATGYKIFYRDRVQAAVRNAVMELANANAVDAQKILKLWYDTVNFDVTEVVQHRRIPCPLCWSTDGKPQMTIEAYFAQKIAHDKRRIAMLRADPDNDIGEFPDVKNFDFIDKNLDPNPECPVCHGLGEMELTYTDTRKLSPLARRMIQSIEVIKGEVNIRFVSKEKAAENLAKAMGLFREVEEKQQDGTVDAGELFRTYEEKMQLARERQARVFKERGIDIVDIEPIVKDENGNE